MTAYELPELLKMWVNEELTAEQMFAKRAHSAIGQLLLHITRLSNAVTMLDKALTQLPPAPPVACPGRVIKRQPENNRHA
jgi:hypothetical protein